MKEQGEEDGIDEKILEVEQTLLEYEWEDEVNRQGRREKNPSKEKSGIRERNKRKINRHVVEKKNYLKKK